MHKPRVALITGGAQGIGKGIARHLLGKGYAVTLIDIDAEAGEECTEELAVLGPLNFIPGDIREEDGAFGAVGQNRPRHQGLPTIHRQECIEQFQSHTAPLQEHTNVVGWRHHVLRRECTARRGRRKPRVSGEAVRWSPST